VSLVVVGAVLTMVGYSLNDTIIIFDRVRENCASPAPEPVRDPESLDHETLPRSVLTTGPPWPRRFALVLLAGEVLRPSRW